LAWSYDMKTVLLLEDDPISLALYRRVLGRECSVLVSKTPDEAIRLCNNEDVDLFIADNLLDGSDSGLQTLKRAHQTRPDLPLLVVSGTPPERFR
jgi:CheY-like chemotaxis protein